MSSWRDHVPERCSRDDAPNGLDEKMSLGAGQSPEKHRPVCQRFGPPPRATNLAE